MKTTSDQRSTPVELTKYEEAAPPFAAKITFVDRGWDSDFDPGLDADGMPQPKGGVRPDFDPSKSPPISLSIPDDYLTQKEHDAGILYFAALERAAARLVEEAKASPARLTEQINAAEEAKRERALLDAEIATKRAEHARLTEAIGKLKEKEKPPA